MRLRDHLALSTAGAALLSPWLGWGAAGLWAGGVLIDGDHYAWFCATRRSLSPRAAVRFFNSANVEHSRTMRALHDRVALLGALVVGLRHRQLLTTAVGMSVHVALDRRHEKRLARARTAALARDGFRCRACGIQTPDVATHLWRQPLLLPSYRTQNLVSLCAPCHEAAHASGQGARSWV